MAKNAFLKKMQAEKRKEAMQAMHITEQWVKQAALDAALITLGYGECMKKDPWGGKRLVSFGAEFIENFQWVLSGLQYTPDADAVRVKVSRLLKAKLPEESYREHEVRYVHWVQSDLECEARKNRSRWKREGMETQHDGGTSELLKGVGKE